MSTETEELLRAGMERFASDIQASPGLTAAGGVPGWRRARAARWRLPDWTLIAGPAVTLGVTLWGIGARPYWGDEADTVSAVSRSVPQLIRLLGHIDAVHGLYYLLLWPVARLAGTGESATRVPSALAMTAAAAGVTAIARRIGSRRAGLYAGLIFAVLPAVSGQGQDARPYAVVTAAAVLASHLLVRAVEQPRPRRLAGYGLSLVLVGYLQMFGLLLVAAHLVTLAGLALRRGTGGPRWPGWHWPGLHRPAWPWLAWHWPGWRWLVTYGAVLAAVLPLLVIGWVQRAAIVWIPRPGWSDAAGAATSLAAGSAASVIVLGLLAAAGVLGRPGSGWLEPAGGPDSFWAARGGGGWAGPAGGTGAAWAAHGGGRAAGWFAVPWLLLPPAVLLAVSQLKPVYNERYVTYCLPAVALLAGFGLAALRQPVRAGMLALTVALAVPPQLSMRTPGGGMRTVAEFLRSRERPGDAIIYPEKLIPPWNLAYPDGFAQLRDLSQAQTAAATGRLYASTVPRPVLERREQGVRRIWAVQMSPGDDPAAYLAPGFHLAHQWLLRGHLRVWLYTKELSAKSCPAREPRQPPGRA